MNNNSFGDNYDTKNDDNLLIRGVDDYLASVRTAVTEQDCMYEYHNGPLMHHAIPYFKKMPDKKCLSQRSSPSGYVDAEPPIGNDDNTEELEEITEQPDSLSSSPYISPTCIDQGKAHQILENLDGLLQRLDLQQLEHDKAERDQRNELERRNDVDVHDDEKQKQSRLLVSSRKRRLTTCRKTKSSPLLCQVPSAQQTIQIYFREGESQGTDRIIEGTSDCATAGNHCGYSTISKKGEGYAREEATRRREPKFETSTNCATADSRDYVTSKVSQSCLRQNETIMAEPNTCSNEGSSNCASADCREYISKAGMTYSPLSMRFNLEEPPCPRDQEKCWKCLKFGRKKQRDEK
eukprot:CAMPEP_0116048632 /NCGR_PEP_ID=MMETSP0321-20121206/29700_1 /TAXON_ID=163516 /ORGANISM="Leptocylindrus danicus var. danicus, Strain B650" /LENGTH=349 /DNA_ID=CAMNT_0003530935 /DNA_START=249 /DNA_END=1298 /DNA_ORIENTATION=-